MSGFIQGADRNQGYLLPERIDEYVSEDNPVRVIEAFIEERSRPCENAVLEWAG